MKWKRSKKAQQEAKISSRDSNDTTVEKRGTISIRTCGTGSNDLQNNTNIRSPDETLIKIDCPTSSASTTIQTQSHHNNSTAQLNHTYHTINNIRSHEQDGNCESLYRPYVS